MAILNLKTNKQVVSQVTDYTINIHAVLTCIFGYLLPITKFCFCCRVGSVECFTLLSNVMEKLSCTCIHNKNRNKTTLDKIVGL